jgi:hypothetical protein
MQKRQMLIPATLKAIGAITSRRFCFEAPVFQPCLELYHPMQEWKCNDGKKSISSIVL